MSEQSTMNDISRQCENVVVVGIHGKRKSGKDTAADHLEHHHGFVRIAFADPIKSALASMFDVDVATFYDQDLKDISLPELLGHTPRHLMQTLGTEWAQKHVQQDLWVALARQRVQRYIDSGKRRIVITDVRFLHEVGIVQEFGGEIWRVVRPGTDKADDHISEQTLPSTLVDAIVVNNRGIRELHDEIGVLFNDFMRRNQP